MSQIQITSAKPRISGRTRKMQPCWEIKITGGPTVEEIMQACAALAVAIATHPDNPRNTLDTLTIISEQSATGIKNVNQWRT